MRWAVVFGSVAPGEGPATEHGGEAFVRAREEIERARRQRDGLLMVTGDPRADELLEDLAPVLAELVNSLSPRQRTVARLALIDELRQAEVADRLDVSRATISVTFARARVRSLERLAAAVRSIFASRRQGGHGMIVDPVLTLAWLVLAHLVADFVIQTNRIATDKFSPGPRAWRGLAAHWAGVAICLLPLPIVFGIPGAIAAIVISVVPRDHRPGQGPRDVAGRGTGRRRGDRRARGTRAGGEPRDGMDADAGGPVRPGPAGARDRASPSSGPSGWRMRRRSRGSRTRCGPS